MPAAIPTLTHDADRKFFHILAVTLRSLEKNAKPRAFDYAELLDKLGREQEAVEANTTKLILFGGAVAFRCGGKVEDVAGYFDLLAKGEA